MIWAVLQQPLHRWEREDDKDITLSPALSWTGSIASVSRESIFKTGYLHMPKYNLQHVSYSKSTTAIMHT